MHSDRKLFHFEKKDMRKRVGPYYLYQIGDMNAVGDYAVEEHKQFVYEVTYIVSGQVRVRVRDEWYAGEQGMVFLHRMDDAHEMIGEQGGNFRYFYLGFDFKDVTDSAVNRIKELFDDSNNVFIDKVPGIQEIFIRLLNENRLADDYCTDKMLESYINEILVAIYRAFEKRSCGEYPLDWQKHASENVVYDIVSYIDLNPFSVRKLSNFEKMFGYSYSYISKRFKVVMGESIQEYCLRRKFDYACEWLLRGISVTEVAERLGYQSVHAFSRAFHRRIGVVPSIYSARSKELKNR